MGVASNNSIVRKEDREMKSIASSKKKIIIVLMCVFIFIVTGFLVWFTYFKIDPNQRIRSITKIHFPQEYIEENRNQVIVEIPEVYELLNIVMALSVSSQLGGMTMMREGEYYQKVLDNFSQFKEHPTVAKISEAVQNYGYSRVRFLFAYDFDGDSIKRNSAYEQDSLKETWDEYAKLLEDFAAKSGFRKFYNENIPFYNEQIQTFKQMIPTRQVWNWIEEQFPQRYDCYKVILSPLVGGCHNTQYFKNSNEDYKEIVMFVATTSVLRSNTTSKEVVEGLLTRMLLTEIDHNYVNPTTDIDSNLRQVIRIFSDLDKWNSQNNYHKPALTFNEYMTWGVACLYSYDTYESKDYDEILKSTIAVMKYRGFYQFEEFYNGLFELYINRDKDETIYDLYPEVLKYAGKM